MPRIDGQVHHLSSCPRSARNEEARQVQADKDWRRERMKDHFWWLSPKAVVRWTKEDWEHWLFWVIMLIVIACVIWIIF